MAREAEAERERRAKVIHAEGEFQAAERLAEAGRVIASQPGTLQLRVLQSLTEIATEKNSTIVFPVPVDLIAQFLPNVQAAQATAIAQTGGPTPGSGGGGGSPPPEAPRPPQGPFTS
jgi:hypothetical protein